MAATRGSLLATAPDRIDEILREAVIIATLITHPDLIPRFETALDRIDLVGAGHDDLRRILLSHLDPATLEDRLRRAVPEALDTLMSRPHVQIAPPVRNRADSDLAALCLAEELAKLDARRGAMREIDDAVQDLSGLADEGLTWRLSQAAAARDRADHPPRADAGELGENRAALSNHLQSLITSRVWEKKKH